MFKRNLSFLKELQLLEKYSDLLNTDNFLTISRWQIYKIFKNENAFVRDVYIHLILSRWVDKQGQFDEKKLGQLKKLIRKYKIKLDVSEQEELLTLEERVFAIDRVIKSLQYSLSLDNGEEVVIRLDRGQLYSVKRKGLKLLQKGELIISNQKFIILANRIRQFTYDEIKGFEFAKYGFEFITSKGVFLIRVSDQETLNNTLINYFTKRQQEFLRKERHERN